MVQKNEQQEKSFIITMFNNNKNAKRCINQQLLCKYLICEPYILNCTTAHELK